MSDTEDEQFISSLAEEAMNYLDRQENRFRESEQELSEVEVRLRKAGLYRAVLDNSLFDNTTELAAEVESEFRSFALARLKSLLGMQNTDKPQETGNKMLPFDENEVKVLKAWASKLLKRPATMAIEPAQSMVVAEPTIQTVVTQPENQRLKQVKATKPVIGRPAKNKLTNESKTSENKQFVQIEHGGKTVNVNMTKPVDDGSRKPMPSQDQTLMLEMQKAQEVQSRQNNLAPLIQKFQQGE